MWKKGMVPVISGCAAVLVVVIAASWWSDHRSAPPASGNLTAAWQGDEHWQVGDLRVHWLSSDAQLRVFRGQRQVWKSLPGEPWLGAALPVAGSTASDAPAERFPETRRTCHNQNWFDVSLGPDAITLSGRLECEGHAVPVEFRFASTSDGRLQLEWSLAEPGWITWLNTAVDTGERFYGLGPLTPEWQLGPRRYRLEASTGTLRPVVLSSTPRAMTTDLPGPVVLDLQKPSTVRVEFLPGDDTGPSGGRLSMLHPDDPGTDSPATIAAKLGRGSEQTSPAPPGADQSLNDFIRQRLAAAINGNTENARLAMETLWLPAPEATAEEEIRWLHQLGVATLMADAWPESVFSTASLPSYLETHAERFRQLHSAMEPYRSRWQQAASETGVPAMRPVWFDYPDQPGAWETDFRQFMLGDRLLVISPELSGREASYYLPPGQWTQIWSGETVHSEGETRSDNVAVGEPLVWLRGDRTEHGALLEVASSVSVSRLLDIGIGFASNSEPLRLE